MSGWQDLNLRSRVSKTRGITKLSYTLKLVFLLGLELRFFANQANVLPLDERNMIGCLVNYFQHPIAGILFYLYIHLCHTPNL